VQFHVLNPLEHADWNDLIASLGSDSFFNTAEWAQALVGAYGFEPCYVTGSEGNHVSSVLPMMEVRSWITGRRGVSLPFSDDCEPMGLDPVRSTEFLGFLKEFGKLHRWRYFEIRNACCFGPDAPVSASYWGHALDLSQGNESLSDRLDSSVRTSIRKAVKAGVEVTFSDGLKEVAEFYRLNCETRRRHGLPPQPFQFFKNLHEHVFTKGLGRVATAWHGGCAIASSVFLQSGRKVLFKYGASDSGHQHLRASNLLMWEAIRRYAQEGYERLSMGRTDRAHSGLRRFKLGWGTREYQIGYVRYDLGRGAFNAERPSGPENGHGIVRHLPLCVLRCAGKALYRHVA
jgi:hypothetical protein